jgi:hypothetical protein
VRQLQDIRAIEIGYMMDYAMGFGRASVCHARERIVKHCIKIIWESVYEGDIKNCQL